MARAERQPKKRSRGSVLTKLLILVILAAIGLQLRSLHSQVQDAQAQRDALTAQVQAQEQENAALAADIAEGATEDKMKEIAQEERLPRLCREPVFFDTTRFHGSGKTIRKEKQYTIWSFR